MGSWTPVPAAPPFGAPASRLWKQVGAVETRTRATFPPPARLLSPGVWEEAVGMVVIRFCRKKGESSDSCSAGDF